MTATLLVFTDGRQDCLERTIASARESLVPWTFFNRRIMIDDSQNPDYARSLSSQFPDFQVLSNASKMGFCGAIQLGWAQIPKDDPESWVFHLEDDFTFNRSVNLLAMLEVIQRNPHLKQIALLRQAWSEEEHKAGGLIQVWPDSYEDKRWNDHEWLEHRLFWTTNPSLYRGNLTRIGWPDGPGCERTWTDMMLTNPTARFAFWGNRNDGPLVTHIGTHRVGTGY